MPHNLSPLCHNNPDLDIYKSYRVGFFCCEREDRSCEELEKRRESAYPLVGGDTAGGGKEFQESQGLSGDIKEAKIVKTQLPLQIKKVSKGIF